MLRLFILTALLITFAPALATAKTFNCDAPENFAQGSAEAKTCTAYAQWQAGELSENEYFFDFALSLMSYEQNNDHLYVFIHGNTDFKKISSGEVSSNIVNLMGIYADTESSFYNPEKAYQFVFLGLIRFAASGLDSITLDECKAYINQFKPYPDTENLFYKAQSKLISYCGASTEELLKIGDDYKNKSTPWDNLTALYFYNAAYWNLPTRHERYAEFALQLNQIKKEMSPNFGNNYPFVKNDTLYVPSWQRDILFSLLDVLFPIDNEFDY